MRIDVSDGWYHVTARGIERRQVFGENWEYLHFQDLLREATERYRIVIHAFVQLRTHYHLIAQTPEANLSKAMQWLNVSYAVWYNRRNSRVGPLMQGRFKSVPVQNSAWAYELSLYVHLNPVMRKAHGLDKRSKQAESMGLAVPRQETVTRRLSALRQYPWSSYPAYTGYAKAPPWLETKELLRRASRKADQRTQRYRRDVPQRVAKGVDPEFKEKVAEGFALGTEEFGTQIRQIAKGGREVNRMRELRRQIGFADLTQIVEALREEKVEDFMSRRGDWARPLLLWAARRYTGMTLKEIGCAAAGMDYTAVAMAIKRFEDRAAKDRGLLKKRQQLMVQCEK
ncbi:MAG: transposase [Kiritimatiellae bacterium]|nr:transposase [Kiritimatiellia bacterium]